MPGESAQTWINGDRIEKYEKQLPPTMHKIQYDAVRGSIFALKTGFS